MCIMAENIKNSRLLALFSTLKEKDKDIVIAMTESLVEKCKDNNKMDIMDENPTDATDQYELGLYYITQYDDKKAEYWIKKAAENGYAVAQNELRSCYLEGALSLVEVKESQERNISIIGHLADIGELFIPSYEGEMVK